jgi:hypothetical protein
MVAPLDSIIGASFERADDEGLGRRHYGALGGGNVLLGMRSCRHRQWHLSWMSSGLILILYGIALLRCTGRRVELRLKWPE